MFGAGGSFLLKQQSLLRVAYCWPLCVNMTASIKPEIHNIATLPEEDRTIAIGNMPKNWQRSDVQFRKYARGQTSRETHRHDHHNTLLTYEGGVIVH